jgi:uncharacterized protein YcaQ
MLGAVMPQIEKLSLEQARKIVVLQNKLHFSKGGVKGAEAALQRIQQMGYVQIDSISVIARAHHHSLYNRVRGYKEGQLSELLDNRSIFEYWSHAAAYLPMVDYRYTLVRKLAIKSGERHWFDVDKKLMDEVLAQIRARGPLMAKDFAHKRDSNSGWWDWKPAKIALEQLFMQGDLMVSERRGFQKVYDLAERVLPKNIDLTVPSQDEYCRFLIRQYLQANGLSKANHFGYLLKGIKKDILKALQAMLEEGEIISISVMDEHYYALPNVHEILDQKLSRTKVKILSPFDNLLIQRKRTLELFDFDYQIECYVPQAKRRFGYFSLPVLQGRSLVARVDVKVHRKQQLMQLNHLHLYKVDLEQLLQPLADALLGFMHFNQADELALSQVSSESGVHNKAQLSAFTQQLIALTR